MNTVASHIGCSFKDDSLEFVGEVVFFFRHVAESLLTFELTSFLASCHAS
jgi:hypothetical protein